MESFLAYLGLNTTMTVADFLHQFGQVKMHPIVLGMIGWYCLWLLVQICSWVEAKLRHRRWKKQGID